MEDIEAESRDIALASTRKDVKDDIAEKDKDERLREKERENLMSECHNFEYVLERMGEYRCSGYIYST